MKIARLPFENFFNQSQISKIQPHINPKNLNQSEQNYKKKYHQYKQNIKQFMLMIEKEFEQLIKKHNCEKQTLERQIVELKNKLTQNQDVSNFTVRSTNINNTDQKPQKLNRSQSREADRIISFEGIESFDRFNVCRKTKNLTEKSLSFLSNSKPSAESYSSFLNKKKASRLSLKTSNEQNQQKVTQNRPQSFLLNYSNQESKKSKSIGSQNCQKQDLDVLLSKILDKKILNQTQKSKNQTQKSQNQTQTNQVQRNQLANKQNFSNGSTSLKPCKNKIQEASIHNVLKNLRSTMQKNIKKESNLEAAETLTSTK